VAGELFEADDADSCGDLLEITPRQRLCLANAAPSNPARPVHRWTVSAIELARPAR
jgi:hypothetical protein